MYRYMPGRQCQKKLSGVSKRYKRNRSIKPMLNIHYLKCVMAYTRNEENDVQRR